MAEKSRAPRFAQKCFRWALIGLLKLPMVLPYRLRLDFVGWMMARVIGPLAGYRRRIRDNLAYVLPDLPEREIRRLQRAVPANAGRMLIESSSGQEFKARIAKLEMTGPGLAALDAAKAADRPIVAVSGHFGNFDAARYALVLRGHSIGSLYRPIDDPVLDRHFHDLLADISEPVFARGRRGLGQMVRFLRKGNMVAILLDQHVNRGAPLSFFGKTAPTSLSAAEMALKYDGLLIPIYGVRTSGGFDLVVEDPIPHTDARAMTQAINDSLERQVRAHMDQWLWIHRRWKPERQRKRAEARMPRNPSS